MSEKKICAAYIRVSTEDQTEYSPESQISLLRDYAKNNNMLLPEEFIFRDDGISGRTARKRPAFMRMIDTAKLKPSPFSVILVWKFSRFARNQEESIVYKSLLQKDGIDVVSISEPLIEGPFGDLIERIIEWTDEYYSVRLSGEVARGMRERATRGKHNSVAPYGYVMESGELVLHPEQAETVREMYRSFLQGETIISIVKRLNGAGLRTNRGKTWENRTVRYILTNPVYAGTTRWNPEGANNYHLRYGHSKKTIIADGSHPAIISPEDFEAAQTRLRAFERAYKSPADRVAQRQDGKHMLQGIVKCSACGGTLTGQTSDRLQCSQYVHGRCSVSHSIQREMLEQMVLLAIETMFETMAFEVQQDAPVMLAGEQDSLQQKIDREQMVLKRLRDAYLAGIDTLEEYRLNRSASERKIERWRTDLQKLLPPEPVDKKAYVEKHRSTLRLLQDPTTPGPEKNSLIRTFVDHVVYFKDPRSVQVVLRG